MDTNKRLAKLYMSNGRVITGLVHEPISHDYYKVQIMKIENPIVDDWQENDEIKISKSIVERFEFL